MKRSTAFYKFPGVAIRNFRRLLKDLYHFFIEHSCRESVERNHKLPQGLPTVDILSLIPDFDEKIHTYTYLDGNSRIIDLAILKALARRFTDGVYMEIGSFRGESIINVAEVAKKCYSISLSDDDLRAFGMDAYVPQNAMFSKHSDNVTHIGHDSTTFDFASLGTKFDLIFIDGDHNYPAVKKDTENAFELLRDDNSIIVWHDCGYSYESTRWPVLSGLLDGCPPEAKKHIYRVSNSLCAIYTKQDLEAAYPQSPNVPNKAFDIHLAGSYLTPINI